MALINKTMPLQRLSPQTPMCTREVYLGGMDKVLSDTFMEESGDSDQMYSILSLLIKNVIHVYVN